MLDPLTMLGIFIAGIFFAILATFVGIGGGLLNVPFLVFVFDLDAVSATLISSVVIVFTSSSGFIKYNALKRIDYKTGLIYLALAVPGSVLGGYIAENIDAELLKRMFAILVFIAAIRGLLKSYLSRHDAKFVPDNISNFTEKELEEENNKTLTSKYRRIVDSEGDIFEYEVKIGIGMFFAFLGGVVAGMLGVGGGIIFVPLLNTISGVPIHVAVAVSTSMIVVVSTIAVITRFIIANSDGTLDLELILSYAVPLAAGSIIGAYIGAAKVKKIKAKQLIALFWFIALLASIRMYF